MSLGCPSPCRYSAVLGFCLLPAHNLAASSCNSQKCQILPSICGVANSPLVKNYQLKVFLWKKEANKMNIAKLCVSFLSLCSVRNSFFSHIFTQTLGLPLHVSTITEARKLESYLLALTALRIDLLLVSIITTKYKVHLMSKRQAGSVLRE